MKNLTIYCMSTNNNNLDIIKSLNYVPVGLKNNNFSDEWLRDDTGDNISYKNSNYGEYTFYYWYWKNLLKFKQEKTWIGFCSYREYWKNNNFNKTKNLKDLVIQNLPSEWDTYDVILGEPIKINDTKLSKILKYGKLAILNNLRAITKKGRNIKWHFDMYHGVGNLDKAIDLLPLDDREEFRNFTRKNYEYSRGNVFITKSSKIMNAYFEYIFTWLKKCEEVFGFNLKGYGQLRIYAFLAERFLPFWFKKNAKCLEWPMLFYDINKLN